MLCALENYENGTFFYVRALSADTFLRRQITASLLWRAAKTSLLSIMLSSSIVPVSVSGGASSEKSEKSGGRDLNVIFQSKGIPRV